MSSCWPNRFDLSAYSAFVLGEVVAEQTRKLFRRLVKSGLVGPRALWIQNVGWHAWALGQYLEAKDGIPLSPCCCQRTVVDGVDNGPGVGEFNALADSVGATAPSRIHQPNAGTVLLHFCRQQLRVFVGMPDQKGSPKAGRKRR